MKALGIMTKEIAIPLLKKKHKDLKKQYNIRYHPNNYGIWYYEEKERIEDRNYLNALKLAIKQMDVKK